MANSSEPGQFKLPATVIFVSFLGAALVVVWLLMFHLTLQRW
jgi:hypothetical protein